MSAANSIYVIEANNGLVKIGVSSNVDQRVGTLHNSLAKQGWITDLYIRFQQVHEDAYKIKRRLHRRLIRYLEFGEWFRLSSDEAIQAVKGEIL